jgi:N-carbamoylputrescine amidase
MQLKVTICEMEDNEAAFLEDWDRLRSHVKEQETDLVLLPEMPFCKWVASAAKADQQVKEQSVKKHQSWLNRLHELDVRYVVFSMPVLEHEKYFNTAYIYERDKGLKALHTKYYFPEEPSFWEATWYQQHEKKFEVAMIDGFKIGILLCTEMWFTEHARAYGKLDIDLLLCPRATGVGSVPQWIRCGQTLAVISGAYCLSSNKRGSGDDGFLWGGNGWAAEPQNGNLLGLTGDQQFLSVILDLDKAREAKKDYPLYVKE